MKYLILSCCTLGLTVGYSQEVARAVIASEGNSTQINQLAISYTVGQPVAGTNSNNRFSITEGFQRGFLEIVTSIPEVLYQPELTVYPNPTQDEIQIEARLPKAMSITAHMYNLSGQILATQIQKIPKRVHQMTLDMRPH